MVWLTGGTAATVEDFDGRPTTSDDDGVDDGDVDGDDDEAEDRAPLGIELGELGVGVGVLVGATPEPEEDDNDDDDVLDKDAVEDVMKVPPGLGDDELDINRMVDLEVVKEMEEDVMVPLGLLGGDLVVVVVWKETQKATEMSSTLST
ncbi:hypothetical protein PG990_003120 [Apiospora arundinis]